MPSTTMSYHLRPRGRVHQGRASPALSPACPAPSTAGHRRDATGEWTGLGGSSFSGGALSHKQQLQQQLSARGCPHAGPCRHGLPLCSRPKSPTSPWTACASPLQRAFSSGRGPATATLILLKKSSLWTTFRLGSCPSRPRGEERAHPPSAARAGSACALKCPPKAV